MQQTKTFTLDRLVGLSNLNIPKLKKDEMLDRCAKIGFSLSLYPYEPEFITLENINKLLACQGREARFLSEIIQTTTFFGTPLPDYDLWPVVNYIGNCQEIVQDELREQVEFKITLIEDPNGDYSKDINKKEFLCNKLYQGIKVHYWPPGGKDIEIPFIRPSPHVGAYNYIEKTKTGYIVQCLSESLFLSSFSEHIHSIANKIIREYFQGKQQSSVSRSYEETFTEGCALHLIDRYRDRLGIPKTVNINPSGDAYRFVRRSFTWINSNGLLAALGIFRSSPKRYFDMVRENI